jgi:hypothetical protein
VGRHHAPTLFQDFFRNSSWSKASISRDRFPIVVVMGMILLCAMLTAASFSSASGLRSLFLCSRGEVASSVRNAFLQPASALSTRAPQ